MLGLDHRQRPQKSLTSGPWPSQRRKARLIPALFLAALALFSGVWAQAKEAERPLSFAKDQLVIETAAGQFTIQVELALSEEQRSRGLMFREEIAGNEGMLFVYDPPQQVIMWMKNTFIALDMLFLGPDGRILSIKENAQPHTRSLIPSGQPVKGVLELSAGAVERFAIHSGDRIIHSLFAH